jgi:hypothetical protein
LGKKHNHLRHIYLRNIEYPLLGTKVSQTGFLENEAAFTISFVTTSGAHEFDFYVLKRCLDVKFRNVHLIRVDFTLI